MFLEYLSQFLFSDIYFSFFIFAAAIILLIMLIYTAKNSKLLYFVIPLYIFVGLTSYFAINNLLGDPSKKISDLDNEFVLLYHVADYRQKKVFLTVRLQARIDPKLYVADDPEGKIEKQLHKLKTSKRGQGSPIMGRMTPNGLEFFFLNYDINLKDSN